MRLYGPWTLRTPEDARKLLREYPGEWWIAGGWAIEAFTGISRDHGDIDAGIFRSDVHLLRRHLAGHLDVWAADHGSLTPLHDDEKTIPATCGNLWLRASGADPWEYDVLLTDVADGRWTYERDRRVSLPADAILWRRDGIAYLRPEIQLLHKAPGRRPQDQQDFEACLPLLDVTALWWLRAALETAHPGHPWIRALATVAAG